MPPDPQSPCAVWQKFCSYFRKSLFQCWCLKNIYRQNWERHLNQNLICMGNWHWNNPAWKLLVNFLKEFLGKQIHVYKIKVFKINWTRIELTLICFLHDSLQLNPHYFLYILSKKQKIFRKISLEWCATISSKTAFITFYLKNSWLSPGSTPPFTSQKS